jgi:hypothetical protein
MLSLQSMIYTICHKQWIMFGLWSLDGILRLNAKLKLDLLSASEYAAVLPRDMYIV